MQFWRMPLAIGLACAAAPSFAKSSPSAEEIAAYRALVVQDARLATIGYRLAYGNRAFCKDKERNPGWVLHDIAQYPDPDIARAAFGFSDPIQISAIVADGPADKAGILVGDTVFGTSNRIIDASPLNLKSKSYDRLARIKAIFADWLSTSGPLSVLIKRGEYRPTATLDPPSVCASDFQIDTATGLDSGADGHMVSVSFDMATYASNDSELAAVVAHELAHNILHHHDRLNAAKVSRGLGRSFGKSKTAILQTEAEADRLSIWLMANAGYDPASAISFWQHYGPEHDNGIFSDGTHYRWKNRVGMLQEEITKIATTPKGADGIMPPLLDNATNPASAPPVR